HRYRRGRQFTSSSRWPLTPAPWATESRAMARILRVDGDPDILLLHRLSLEAAGHEVLLAADGMKALERIRADSPDCVVLDVMMPVLDGWRRLEALQGR